MICVLDLLLINLKMILVTRMYTAIIMVNVFTDVGRITFMRENRMGVILSAMNTFTDNPNIHRCCCKVIAVVTLCKMLFFV